MRDFKLVPVFALLITLLFVSVSSISAASSAKSTVLESEVYKNVPEENWSSIDQLTTSDARFIMDNINISGERVFINGQLEYNGKKVTIEQEGYLEKGEIKPDLDLVIEFANSNKNNSNSMELIHGMVIQNATKAQLDEEKDLVGTNVLKLVFFDDESRDLVIFEEDLKNIPNFIVNQSTLNYNSLNETKSEIWYYKVVKPSFESFSLEGNESEIPESIKTYIDYLEGEGESIYKDQDQINLQAQTYSRDDTLFGVLTYRTHLGTTTHYMRLYAYANMLYPQREASLNTGIRVENKSIQLPDGSWINGRSNLEAGRGNRPVATLVHTYPNNSSNASYVSTLQWSGNYFERTGSSLSFSISLQRGPLSASASYTPQYLSERFGNLVNVYEAGPQYPREAKSEFDNTLLSNINHRYLVNYEIRTEGTLTTQRALRVRFHVPFHDSLQFGSGAHVDNATTDMYLYYK